MWFRSDKRLDVLWALLLLNKRKLFGQRKRKTIPNIAGEIFSFLKDKDPDLSIKTVEKYIYELRDAGLLNKTGTSTVHPGRNGEANLYKVDEKKIIVAFKEEFETTCLFKILDKHIYDIVDVDF